MNKDDTEPMPRWWWLDPWTFAIQQWKCRDRLWRRNQELADGWARDKKRYSQKSEQTDFLASYLYADALAKGDLKRLRNEVNRLTKLTEWQPIKTAPKDGTIIIGFVPKPDDIYSGVCDVKWIAEDYQELNGIKYKFGGHFGKPSYNNVVVRPSHWMPLPEPPQN